MDVLFAKVDEFLSLRSKPGEKITTRCLSVPRWEDYEISLDSEADATRKCMKELRKHVINYHMRDEAESPDRAYDFDAFLSAMVFHARLHHLLDEWEERNS